MKVILKRGCFTDLGFLIIKMVRNMKVISKMEKGMVMELITKPMEVFYTKANTAMTK